MVWIRRKLNEILDMVFSERKYNIENSEEPDFILTHKHGWFKIGVEITEFFKDEAHARLYNMMGILMML